jgi:hypothetical protein
MAIAPVLSGSSQSFKRDEGVPPPSHDTDTRPYQSEVWLEQEANPPCNCPTIRWFGSYKGEPDDPPSVVPSSQSITRMCVPAPGTVFCKYDVVVVGSFSKLMRFSSVPGW